jgi:NAD(P)-dependent dehydrogenase (short-subunit alcohol dehydrogenase family)
MFLLLGSSSVALLASSIVKRRSTPLRKNVHKSRPRIVKAFHLVHTPLLSYEEKSKIGLGKTAIIAGATGYIGKAVVAESIQRGYRTVALVRNKDRFFTKETNGTKAQLQPLYAPYFQGAILEECDVENPDEVESIFQKYSNQLDVVCSCLASASGIKGEPRRIDYQATLNLLNSCRNIGARHFILLSAFCVAKPLLELQRQKLRVGCFKILPVLKASISNRLCLVTFSHFLFVVSLKRSSRHKMM